MIFAVKGERAWSLVVPAAMGALKPRIHPLLLDVGLEGLEKLLSELVLLQILRHLERVHHDLPAFHDGARGLYVVLVLCRRGGRGVTEGE